MNLALPVSPDLTRWLGSAALLLAYATLCGVVWRQERQRAAARQRDRADLLPAAVVTGTTTWTVAYASQTGSAEQIALRTAQTLHAAGLAVRLCSLDELDAAALAQVEHLLLVVSTYGEGDPPDNAARFSRQLLQPATGLPADQTQRHRLQHLKNLRYGVLALGDRGYARFCGFGRTLDAWLQDSGARPLFERIEVDQLDPTALQAWHEQLCDAADLGDAPGGSAVPVLIHAAPFADWRLAERRQLNPGSLGEPVYHLELEPIGAPLPDWQAGDLAQVRPPDVGTGDGGTGDARPRDYSIASVPADGRLHLLVRLQRRTDGTPGRVSGWLGLSAAIGERVALRLREHRAFRAGSNAARPLILIGNGTGMAGLRSHLKARASAPATKRAPCWLIYGERQAAHDFHHQADLVAWQAAGVLARIDAVFSRDQAERRYVQHRVHEAAQDVRDWIDRGAAIYVCGSLHGMAAGVDQALRNALGDNAVDELARAGRYRRDVY
jgi:sulfite reductase (NADPH) flavoprotein alpha-component